MAQKLHIVSNRLPIDIKKDKKRIVVKQSIGGLATGMKDVYKTYDCTWYGWPGINQEVLNAKEIAQIGNTLEEENCYPVYIPEKDFEGFYFGFCNKTLWPLFHYFTQYAEYDDAFFYAYQNVNVRFAEILVQHVQSGDTVWVHDYQLLLLPKLLREAVPNITIGFFLHIPFPSYEVFRLLPYRSELLDGMLGADLIGFHTYDYVRHFVSSIRRLRGLESEWNRITYNDRIIKVEAFPMSIDFDRFAKLSNQLSAKGEPNDEIYDQLGILAKANPGLKFIISIDRLDYTKGIPARLQAFETFLRRYPDFIGKVTLIMLATPTREQVSHYQNIKREVEEMVGRINGEFRDLGWTPVLYLYRTLPVEKLVSLYKASQIALITPLRDGMNLVAKEYLACKTDESGVLILSEMAGAAREMGEALLVNPNDSNAMADTIYLALSMSIEEQQERNRLLRERLKRYNVSAWNQHFLDGIEETKKLQRLIKAKRIGFDTAKEIFTHFAKATSRILFLDYDGTLAVFKNDPRLASPNMLALSLLKTLSGIPGTEVVIISGRDKDTLEQWLGGLPVTLIAEHGVWYRPTGNEWRLIEVLNTTWKNEIRPFFETYVDRTPGTFIEEKNYSLVWHYRKADPDLGNIRAWELKDELHDMVSNLNLEILEGHKVIEVKTAGVNKGKAALMHLNGDSRDFILGMGDDWTDEYLFEFLPGNAWTIKVGPGNTKARYRLDTVTQVLDFLGGFVLPDQ